MKIHYSKVVIFDLIIQLDYDHVIQITKLSDISLSLRSFNQNNLINSNLALFLISNQVPDFRFKADQNPLSKNFDITSFIHLKQQTCLSFLYFLVACVYPNVAKFQGFHFKTFDTQGNLSIQFNSLLCFPQLKENYIQFTHLNHLNLHFKMNKNCSIENWMWLRGFRFPII